MDALNYRKTFDPSEIDRARPPMDDDLTDGQVYVFDDEAIILAVNIALATGRPLLVYGPAGSGKSALASNVARILNYKFLPSVITSRTEPRDLLWRLDAIRRLSDAQVGALRGDEYYLERGVIWQAFEPPEGAGLLNAGRSVVLLDEIDKADPDLPDALLGPLGSLEFEGPDGRVVRATSEPPLIIITSNQERSLSRPFLRRCVILTLHVPTVEHLMRVATSRLGPSPDSLYESIARLVTTTWASESNASMPGPSTAEYLDAVRACLHLGILVSSPEWDVLSRAVLTKHPEGTAG